MSVVNVNVQPEVLRWALSQSDKDCLGTQMLDGINQWIDGTKTPTFKQLESFSRKVNIPLGYFFLPSPPEERIQLLDYRTIDSVELTYPSRDLIDTIHEMEDIQGWMKDYRQSAGFDVLHYVGSVRGSSNVDLIVNTIRNDLDLDYMWYETCTNTREAIKYVRTILENCGVIVMQNGIVGKNTHRALNIEEFRAFAMVDVWAPLIFLNSSDSQGARLFSLFHEVAHIWLGEDDLYNDRRNNQKVKPIEVLCNAVASELMVPMDKFAFEWKKSVIKNLKDRIHSLSKIFNCGESVIARKALDGNMIKPSLYNEIVEDAIKAYKTMKDKQKDDGGNYYNNLGSRLDGGFVRALCESIGVGRTTLTEACRLTNTNRKTFPEIASRFGGRL